MLGLPSPKKEPSLTMSRMKGICSSTKAHRNGRVVRSGVAGFDERRHGMRTRVQQMQRRMIAPADGRWGWGWERCECRLGRGPQPCSTTWGSHPWRTALGTRQTRLPSNKTMYL